LSYSYSYGVIARIAMQVYLATIGSGKGGFTVVGKEPGSQPRYVGAMRGVTERNTMRYYLAVEAYLGALSVPKRERTEKSLRDWFDAIERYPRQLHEMQRDDYLAMKRREYARQTDAITWSLLPARESERPAVPSRQIVMTAPFPSIPRSTVARNRPQPNSPAER